MKTKQTLQNYFILFFAFLLISSCQKEEKLPQTTSSILGEWILDEVEIKTLDTNNNISNEKLSGFGAKITFQNDDTYLKIDTDDALKLNLDIDGFGTWEFTSNYSKIVFSRGVYSFGGGKELMWTIRELTNDSFIAVTFDNTGRGNSQTFIYTFNRTSQSGGDTSPKDVISQKWQLDKVDFKRNILLRPNKEAGKLVEQATVKGFGADINFLADAKYIFDANKNSDYAALFGALGGDWKFDFPYTTLEIQKQNGENWKAFEVQELSADKLVLYFQSNRVGETILGKEDDYYEEFILTFTPFDAAQDAAQKPLTAIFLQKWFIDQIDVNITLGDVFSEKGAALGYGESIAFSLENGSGKYTFIQAGNPNFSDTFEDEGAWQLPFPYTKLWINPKYSFVNEVVLDISQLTDNQFVITASDMDIVDGITLEQDLKIRFVSAATFELLPSPKDSLKGEWELVLINTIQTENGSVISQSTETNFDQIKLTFENLNDNKGEPSYFSAPRNPELLVFFPSEASWQFSIVYQYLIINNRPYRIDIFERNRIQLTLDVPNDDGTSTAYSFVFLRFGTRNSIPDNAAELVLGEWQLDTLVSESFDDTGVLDSQIFGTVGGEFLLNFKSDKSYSFVGNEAYLLSVFANSGIWQVVEDSDNKNVFFLFISNSNNQNPIDFFIFNLSENRLELFREFDDSDTDGNQFKTRHLYIFNKP